MSLIGCSTIVKTEYIKQQIPELPKEPTYFNVIWQGKDGLYCTDADNAKNLLKNVEIDRAYGNDLKTILEQLGCESQRLKGDTK